jgi:hypothetical protein
MIAFFLAFTLSLSLQGCMFMGIGEKKETDKNQMGFGTTWRSEDGKIQFTIQTVVAKEVHSDGKEFTFRSMRGVGTMETGNGCIDIWITQGWDYASNKSGHGDFIIKLAPEDDYDAKITLECGLRGPLEDGKVTVTFTTTTYLEENAVITFYHVDE